MWLLIMGYMTRTIFTSVVVRCVRLMKEQLFIEKGGTDLGNIGLVMLTAFVCSLVASLKDLAEMFPDWIKLDEDGVFT